MVVVPLGTDHLENAAAVERAGAGIVVAPDRLTADTVADSAARGLSDDGLRRAATRIAAELSGMPAASDAVPRIEQLVHLD